MLNMRRDYSFTSLPEIIPGLPATYKTGASRRKSMREAGVKVPFFWDEFGMQMATNDLYANFVRQILDAQSEQSQEA